MAAPIAFVSQTERRRERDEKRKAQAAIIQKAKDVHDRKEQKKEAHRLRGDDKWMLSSVSDRIQAEGEKLKTKKHKEKKDKKKKKKRKKEKKEKHKKYESNSDDSSSSEDDGSDEMEWVETASSKPTGKVTLPPRDQIKPSQREDWMSNPFTMATYSRDDLRREKTEQKENAVSEKEKEQKMLLDNPGRSDRELNPFWKDGGTGLPEEQKQNTPAAKVGIADAGAGWLKKQYQRIVERSETEGRSIEELAAERWGSLEKYHELLAKAQGALGRPLHRDSNRPWQHRGAYPRRDRDADPRRDRDADPRRDRDADPRRNRDADPRRDRDADPRRDRDADPRRDRDADPRRNRDADPRRDRDADPRRDRDADPRRDRDADPRRDRDADPRRDRDADPRRDRDADPRRDRDADPRRDRDADPRRDRDADPRRDRDADPRRDRDADPRRDRDADPRRDRDADPRRDRDADPRRDRDADPRRDRDADPRRDRDADPRRDRDADPRRDRDADPRRDRDADPRRDRDADPRRDRDADPRRDRDADPRRDRDADPRRDRDADPRRDRDADPRRNRDMHRDNDRYREGRDKERDYDRRSDRPEDRAQGRNRSPDRDAGRPRDRHTDRDSGSSSRRDGDAKTSGRTFMRPGESDGRPRHRDSKSTSLGSLGGLQGMFKKPGEESVGGEREARRREGLPRGEDNTPSWRKKSFMRPSGDREEVSRPSPPPSSSKANPSGPAWKKQTAVKLDDPAEKSRTPEEGSRSPSRSDSSSSTSGSDSDSGSDAEESRSPSPPPKILTETEMNQLGAKIVKAELMGNEDLVKKLKAQMEASRQAKAKQATKADPSSAPVDKRKRDGGAMDEEKEVVLTRVDRTGQSWPIMDPSGPGSSDQGKKRKKKQNILTHDKDGQRERYFGDDDQQDLRDMVRKERMTSGEDQLRLFNKVANKALKKLTDDHTLDDMFVSAAAQKRPSGQEEERQKAAAIGQHRKMATSMANCPYCLDSSTMQKHMIIALGIKVYLCLPSTQSLTEGHCLIVPMQHTVASTVLDEDVWSEVQVYRKGLTRMFEDQDRDAIFLETCMNPRGHRHMAIECVPLPKELGDMAPIYFKKAIQESESEWSQNKKLVDTRKKDIRRSVPQGFPYFSVDFGLDGGFAHVIEDEKVFPHYFGKEIIGGMMDLEPQLWRRPHRQNFDDQRRKVLQFGEWWKPFDWTQRIGKD